MEKGDLESGYQPLLAENKPAKGENIANKMGTYLGVFQPCVLNIFGAIVFLRLSWCVGETGWGGSLVEFGSAVAMVLLTVFSIAAISTNGSMKGGGAYYMISRSMGPELGGAAGIIWYLAQAVSVTFYVLGFSEGVYKTFFDVNEYPHKHHVVMIIAAITMVVLLIVACSGANFFLKLNTPIFIILMCSITCVAISMWVGGGRAAKMDGYTGFDMDTLKDNAWFKFAPNEDGTSMNFFTVFLIILPALLGVQAGANLSGDLADPGKSIGKGTLLAVAYCMTIYIFLIFTIGGTVKREQLLANKEMFEDVVFNKYIVAFGLFVATISSAIGSFTGSARILQALARDKLIPGLGMFGYGTKKGDEPIVALILTYAIAQACLFAGSLDMVATLISNFSLLIYAFVNLSCFALRITGAPNFRPHFKFFSWHTALVGGICCCIVMFMGSFLYSIVAFFTVLVFALVIHYTAPVVPWGDLSQALIYHQVRKFLLRLDERKSHPKFWRPSVLFLTNNPAGNIAEIDFCNNLKKGGLYMIGSCLEGDLGRTGKTAKELRKMWLSLIDTMGIKAFAEVCCSIDRRDGFSKLIQLSGVGGMKPNTVVMHLESQLLDEPTRPPSTPNAKYASIISDIETEMKMHEQSLVTFDNADSFCATVDDALYGEKNVVLTRNFDFLDKELIVSFKKNKVAPSIRRMYVDIWSLGVTSDPDFQGEVSLCLQLAHVLLRTDIWSDYTTLRMNVAVERNANIEEVEKDMANLCKICRVDCVINILPCDGVSGSGVTKFEVLNKLIKEQSEHTCLTMIGHPHQPCEDGNEVYLNGIKTISDGIPPSVFITSGRSTRIIATEI